MPTVCERRGGVIFLRRGIAGLPPADRPVMARPRPMGPSTKRANISASCRTIAPARNTENSITCATIATRRLTSSPGTRSRRCSTSAPTTRRARTPARTHRTRRRRRSRKASTQSMSPNNIRRSWHGSVRRATGRWTGSRTGSARCAILTVSTPYGWETASTLSAAASAKSASAAYHCRPGGEDSLSRASRRDSQVYLLDDPKAAEPG